MFESHERGKMFLVSVVWLTLKAVDDWIFRRKELGLALRVVFGLIFGRKELGSLML